MSSAAASLFAPPAKSHDLATVKKSSAGEANVKLNKNSPTFKETLDRAVDRNDSEKASQTKPKPKDGSSTTDSAATEAETSPSTSKPTEEKTPEQLLVAQNQLVAPTKIIEKKAEVANSFLQRAYDAENEEAEAVLTDPALLATTTGEEPVATEHSQLLSQAAKQGTALTALLSQIVAQEMKEKFDAEEISAKEETILPDEGAASEEAALPKVESLAQLLGMLHPSSSNPATSPTSDTKDVNKSAELLKNPAILAALEKLGTGYANHNEMLSLNAEFAELKVAVEKQGANFARFAADLPALLPDHEALGSALKENGISSRLDLGSASTNSLTTSTTLVADKSVTLSSNDQFIEVIRKALLDNPIPTPSRIQVALTTPYGAQVTVYFMKMGDQVRAQLSANDQTAMNWLQNQLNDLRGLESAQNVIWLPPQMETKTSTDSKQFGSRDQQKGETDAEKEANFLDLDEVLATGSGSDAGADNSSNFSRN